MTAYRANSTAEGHTLDKTPDTIKGGLLSACPAL